MLHTVKLQLLVVLMEAVEVDDERMRPGTVGPLLGLLADLNCELGGGKWKQKGIKNSYSSRDTSSNSKSAIMLTKLSQESYNSIEIRPLL